MKIKRPSQVIAPNFPCIAWGNSEILCTQLESPDPELPILAVSWGALT